jgi:hypothetical protein
MAHTRLQTVEKSFYIDTKNAVKVGFGRAFDRTNVRNSRIIHQDVDSPALKESIEFYVHVGLISHIAGERLGIATGLCNFSTNPFGVSEVYIQNTDCGPIGGERQRNGAANAAASTGNYSGLAVQPEMLRIDLVVYQKSFPNKFLMPRHCKTRYGYIY